MAQKLYQEMEKQAAFMNGQSMLSCLICSDVAVDLIFTDLRERIGNLRKKIETAYSDMTKRGVAL